MFHSSYIGEVSLVEDPQLQLQCILVRISIEFLYIVWWYSLWHEKHRIIRLRLLKASSPGIKVILPIVSCDMYKGYGTGI